MRPFWLFCVCVTLAEPETWQYSFASADIVNVTSSCPQPQFSSSCEAALLVDSTAVFSAVTGDGPSSAPDHHRLAALAIGGSLWKSSVMSSNGGWGLTVRVRIIGNFSAEACDPTAAGENRTTECDLVVGISDGRTVLAVSRGLNFSDTLVPFKEATTRPGKGHYYDSFQGYQGGDSDWWMAMELSQGSGNPVAQMRLWADGSDDPKTPNTYTGEQYTGLQIDDDQGLYLVLFRDDRPQNYVLHSLDVWLELEGNHANVPDSNSPPESLHALGVMLGLSLVIALGLMGVYKWRRRRKKKDRLTGMVGWDELTRDFEVDLDLSSGVMEQVSLLQDEDDEMREGEEQAVLLHTNAFMPVVDPSSLSIN
jgi:hypothetical protein